MNRTEKANDKVFVYVWVKPYVYKHFCRKFYIKNCRIEGAIKLPPEDEAYKYMRYRLQKPSHRYDKRMRGNVHRNCRIAIQITDFDFGSMGYELSPTDEGELAFMMENRVQSEMILWVGVHYMMGGALKRLCLEWLEQNQMNCNDWSVESMVKMCGRKQLHKERKEMKEFIDEKINQIINCAVATKTYFRTSRKEKKHDE